MDIKAQMPINTMPEAAQIFPGVYRSGESLMTKNLIPGERSLTEQLVKIRGTEYRVWDHWKSKAAAAIRKGLKNFPIKDGSKILYLGLASGSTASFFSDIIGKSGIIYGVEISERSLRDANLVAEKRGNIVPVLANARLPEAYSWAEKVDIVYQDVATDDQSEILIRNCKAFLKKDGFAMIAIKARSIDVTKEPKEVYRQELEKLKKEFQVMEKVELDPFEKDHMFVVLKWR